MRSVFAVLGSLLCAAPSLVLAQGRECPEERPDSLARATPPSYRKCVEEGSVLLLETNQAVFGAAVIAATRRRFRPASLGEQPVRQWVTYRIAGRAPERVPFAVVRGDRMPALPPPSSRPVTVSLDAC